MGQILLARSAGYCFGVRRALKLAENGLKQAAGRPVYSLGPLIHNPWAVRSLEEEGLRVVSSLSEIPLGGAVVIIRSHGVPPEIYREAAAAGLQVVDATCPLVRKVQRLAHLLREEGYQVVILGDEDHPEVKGVKAYGGAGSVILGEERGDPRAFDPEAEPLLEPHRLRGKIGVVVQTTFPLQAFQSMTQALLERAGGDLSIPGPRSGVSRSWSSPPLREIRIFNTLCPFTLARQQEAQELASQADVILVVGGRNSANTTRLVELCRQLQPHTYQVEEAQEVEDHWLWGKACIGITAGASTPPWTIKEVQIRAQSFLDQNFL